MTVKDKILAMLLSVVACGEVYAQSQNTTTSKPAAPSSNTRMQRISPNVAQSVGNVPCPPQVNAAGINLPAGWQGGSVTINLSYGYLDSGHPNAIYCYYNPNVLIYKTVPPNSCKLAGNKKSFICN